MGCGGYSSKKLGECQREIGRLCWQLADGKVCKATRKVSEAAGSASEAAAAPFKG